MLELAKNNNATILVAQPLKFMETHLYIHKVKNILEMLTQLTREFMMRLKDI